MARVTRVEKAQQRYQMVPVLNPDGSPKRIDVKRETKSGRAVTREVTVADKTKPLPMPTCDMCHGTIEVGTPYMWIAPKSGPYGGAKRYRHAHHPTWHVWEYSNSTSARLAQIQHEFAQGVQNCNTTDDLTSEQNAAAEAIREVAQEKRDGAQNIEDGFGHATYVSDEMNEQADSLDSWADEVEGFDVPEIEAEEVDCEECDGTASIECELCVGVGKVPCKDCSGKGTLDDGTCETCGGDGEVDCSNCDCGDVDCENCDGTGTVPPDEPSEDDIDSWRDDVLSGHPIDDCPL